MRLVMLVMLGRSSWALSFSDERLVFCVSREYALLGLAYLSLIFDLTPLSFRIIFIIDFALKYLGCSIHI